jgi:long-chain acyl-CoA synthetase
MKTSLLKLTIAVSLILTTTTVSAAELGGVSMPEQMPVDGKALKLNGLGMRQATIFNVKVYVGGLYLETPSKNDMEIIASNQIKRVQMQFVREVEAEKLRDTWKENIEKNCGPDCASYKPFTEKLLTFFDKDVRKGDTMTFTFYPSKVDVYVGSDKKGEITNGEFGRVMLMSWIGPNPPNASLKRGMLGEK